MPRPCPTCGRPLTFRSARPAEAWRKFWSHSTLCPGCRAVVRLHLGLGGRLRLALLCGAGPVPAYLLARSLTGPWPVLAFLLLFPPALIAVAAAGQWVRWTYGTAVADRPVVPGVPR